MQRRSAESNGLLLGLGAYGIWGFFPLYFPLLAPSSATEVLAHRIVWSFVFMIAVNSAFRLWAPVRDAIATPRIRRLLFLAAVLITVNWGVYIWAVQHDHVVEAALGYFMTPLLSVALGIVAFGERLRRPQWVALGIGAASLIVLAIDAHSVPWIGLILALSFGAYGLVKKLANVEAMTSLTIETAFATPIALVYLVHLEATGSLAFLHTSTGHTLTVLTTGIVTAVPLLGFSAAAVRIPLSTLGLLQYITPVLQFILGILVFHERMSALRWLGFACLWLALLVYSTDMVRHTRARRA